MAPTVIGVNLATPLYTSTIQNNQYTILPIGIHIGEKGVGNTFIEEENEVIVVGPLPTFPIQITLYTAPRLVAKLLLMAIQRLENCFIKLERRGANPSSVHSFESLFKRRIRVIRPCYTSSKELIHTW